MKIAIMMRPIDQDSGFRAYTEMLVDTMLRIDRENRYLLFYRQPKYFGRFARFPNVKEMLLKAPHKLAWDQAAVPLAALKERADIIFNPKFSVPLISPCPVAMGLQEPAWWTWPEHYEPWDARYNRTMLPLYIRKAAHIFPMSNFILEENRRVLGLPFENATVAYSAPSPAFHPIEDRQRTEDFRQKHGLPKRLILCVTRVIHSGVEGSNTFFPGKNPETAFRAFSLIRRQIPHSLVFAGKQVREYLLHTEGSQVDLERVHFIDFVPYDELPLLYNLAELFVNPTYYEGCPNTVLEAMACGLPLVVANTGGSVDVGGGAAELADPYDPADFAAQMARILQDGELRRELRARSLRKAAEFNWEKTARLTIAGLVEAAHRSKKKGDTPKKRGPLSTH